MVRGHCRLKTQADSVAQDITVGLTYKPGVLLKHHCRLDLPSGSVSLSISVGSSHKPTVLSWATLSVRATSRQWCLEHHYRLEPQASRLGPQAGSVLLSITIGSGHKPTVFSWASTVGSSHKSIVLAQLDTVGWCQEPTLYPWHHWRFWVTGSDVNPTSLPVCHCRFKI
jgi:hypothetical protein